MAYKRAHVVFPADLLMEVDALVGLRGRSAFLTEVVREAVNRRRLLQFLSAPDSLLTEAYPEFDNGSADWVRQLRDRDLLSEREKLDDWVGAGHSTNE